VQSGRKKFHGGVFLPDSTTLQRYCKHNPDIRIYRTNQNDEIFDKASDAVDGDNIILTTNECFNDNSSLFHDLFFKVSLL